MGSIVDELLAQLTGKLGLDSSIAQAGIGKTMAMVKEHAGDDLFGKIAAAIPGLDQAVASSESQGTAAGSGMGMLGKLAGLASSALGGKAGQGLELGAALAALGINSDKLGPFLNMVITFLKSKVGDDVMDQVVSKFPVLKTLIS